MHLPSNGCEYVTWPITGQPTGATFDITFDDGATWLPMETVDTGARMLLAGPDVVSPPPGSTVLVVGRTLASIRLADSPETVIRDGGFIDVS